MTHPQTQAQISQTIWKLKNEKHEYLETKYLVNEKFTKNEVKEYKDHHKSEFEVPVEIGPVIGPDPLSKQALLNQAEALEAAGKQIRHFIEQSERPDLSDGALRNEPDQG